MADSINDIARAGYISFLALPANTTLSLTDLAMLAVGSSGSFTDRVSEGMLTPFGQPPSVGSIQDRFQLATGENAETIITNPLGLL